MNELSLQTELRAFGAAFDKYRQFNRRNVGTLIESRARRVRFALWKAFREMAKTPSALRAEVKSLGYAIKRRPDPDLAAAFPNAAKVGAVPRVSLKREIQLRVRSLRYLSVSFLYQSWRAARDGQEGRFAARTRMMARLGEAVVHTSARTPEPFVALSSFLQGVVKQDRQRAVAAKVVRAQTADIAAYLARKNQEELARSFQRTYAATLHVA